MNAKAVQITLVVVAVLCAVGIFALLGSEDTGMPDGYTAPKWMSGLSGIAARPTVSRSDLREERSREPFPAQLTIHEGRERSYRVAPDLDTRARTLEIHILRGSPTITFKPNNSKQEEQSWPSKKHPDADPKFTVDSEGGTLALNVESGSARVRIEE